MSDTLYTVNQWTGKIIRGIHPRGEEGGRGERREGEEGERGERREEAKTSTCVCKCTLVHVFKKIK